MTPRVTVKARSIGKGCRMKYFGPELNPEERPMRFSRSMACLFLFFVAGALAQTMTAQTRDTAAIEQVLRDQQTAWNRGDIEAFMRGYLDSPNTTFIGKTISHGYQPILERYRKSYSSRAAM